MTIPLILSLYHFTLIAMASLLCFKMQYCPKELYLEWVNVVFFGLLGGCVYCIRGIYIQYCAKKEWDNCWILWHIVRPFISAIAGGMSLVFLKAGLLVFQTNGGNIDKVYAIYALAFIAGLNVDNFMRKIESIFNELLGIAKSNLSKKDK